MDHGEQTSAAQKDRKIEDTQQNMSTEEVEPVGSR